MFKHLLVPLDGSRLAEAVLPAAAYLARTLGAWVTLLHVIEHNAPEEIHGERHLRDPEEAAAYLYEVAIRAFPSDLRVEWHVHTTEVRDVALAIAEHIEELEFDLVIMCTHGYGGLRDWLFGSIAQQVIALAISPVLLIRPSRHGTAPSFSCQRILVPLDGDPEHEQGLVVAADLARACAAILHLLMVVHTLHTLPGQQAATAMLLPGTTSALLDLTQERAEEYLIRQIIQLQAQELSATTEVCRGDPVTGIVHAAHRLKVNLIVLGTHGKKGTDAFWSGSITPKISQQSHVPLLLVPFREPEQ